MRILVCCLLLVSMMVTPSFALDNVQKEQLKVFYKKAKKAIAEGKIHEADFWMARHMAIRYGAEGLLPLIKERDLQPTSFISGNFSESFLEFFILGPTTFWDRPEGAFSEKDLSFVIRNDQGQGYYAVFYGSPELEAWSIIKNSPEQAVIPLIAFDPRPVLKVGQIGKNKPSDSLIEYPIETDDKYIQTVFPIEFINLDGEKVPSIFLRYNVAWGDGFEQRLDILKIVSGKKLVLFKRFTGDSEGLARRLPDGKIEVGEGYSSKDQGHMGFDMYRIVTWEYKNKKFVKVGERTMPHILCSDEWEKYYFPKTE